LLGYSPASPLPLFSRCVFFCHGDRRHPPSFPTRRSSDLIGMPGAEAYASVLNRLAEVGGTAQTGETAYYAVSDAPALEQALLEIGTGVAIECAITLADMPERANLVNVFFDGQLVPQNADNGWDWDAEATLSLRGEACTRLRSGSVLIVDVTYGCTTVVE